MNQRQGFTLIEVVLALAILALAFTAIVVTLSERARSFAHLQNKTIANWVADNVITQAQLKLIPIQPGDQQTGTETMYQQTWYWHAKLAKTDNQAVNKIEVDVSNSEQGSNLIHIIGFLPNE